MAEAQLRRHAGIREERRAAPDALGVGGGPVPARRLLIDLPVRNEWSNIELVRTAILNCFAAVFNDLDSCRTIATVISELLENAIKYGDWESGAGHLLHLAITGEEERVTVSVEHPVEPTSDD